MNMNLSMFGVFAFGFIVQVIFRVVYGVFGGSCVCGFWGSFRVFFWVSFGVSLRVYNTVYV